MKKNILLFGVSNVGKTTTGKIVAEKLGCSFYGIDGEEPEKAADRLIKKYHL